jgi:hypothetical protein
MVKELSKVTLRSPVLNRLLLASEIEGRKEREKGKEKGEREIYDFYTVHLLNYTLVV